MLVLNNFATFLLAAMLMVFASLARVSKRLSVWYAALILTMFSGLSHAAVPASVTTGISDAIADVGTIGSAVLGVIIAIAAFMWIRHVLR